MQMIRNEDTSENRERKRVMELMDSAKEKIERLLADETGSLKFIQKGDLAAFWIACWGYCHADVAERLVLMPNALRQAKNRALVLHPCGDPKGVCIGEPGCSHQRGRELWDVIAQRVAARFGQEEERDEERIEV
jgi:hypothetical protein